MKLGIVGVGAVGAATAIAVVLRGQVRELVLVDKNRARARAVATDMTYGVPLSPLVAIKEGEYDDIADAGVVIVTAGINEKAGGAVDRGDPAGRLRLLDANVAIYQDVIPQLVRAAPKTACSAPALISIACAFVYISPNTSVSAQPVSKPT